MQTKRFPKFWFSIVLSGSCSVLAHVIDECPRLWYSADLVGNLCAVNSPDRWFVAQSKFSFYYQNVKIFADWAYEKLAGSTKRKKRPTSTETIKEAEEFYKHFEKSIDTILPQLFSAGSQKHFPSKEWLELSYSLWRKYRSDQSHGSRAWAENINKKLAPHYRYA